MSARCLAREITSTACLIERAAHQTTGDAGAAPCASDRHATRVRVVVSHCPPAALVS